MIDPTAAVDLLSRLIACPSVNPGSAPPSWPPTGEDALARLLAELLSGWGADVSLQEVAPGRPNLLARFDGRDTTRSLLFEAHSDTVPADEMVIDPFTPVLRGNRLHGRGACDTKGPMAAMLLAIREILERDGPPPCTLWFASTCNEELGGSGARALMEQGFRPGAAVIAEPTGLRVVHAHKGALRMILETGGVAAHGSTPERGENAILKMRRVLEHLEDRVAPALAARRHPLLGAPTINVGTIRGGSQANIVPSRCQIEVDRRIVPGESPESILGEILAPDVNRHEISHLYPPLDLAPDHPLARALAVACREITGEARLGVEPYATNAGFFQASGIPAVVFGPGSVDQAHRADEWIDIDQLVAGARVYAAFLRDVQDALPPDSPGGATAPVPSS